MYLKVGLNSHALIKIYKFMPSIPCLDFSLGPQAYFHTTTSFFFTISRENPQSNLLLLMLYNDLISCVFTASTVRHLYLRGGAGVGSMTKIYGSRQRNGVCPAHYSVGSKNVARKVLQALELLKMIEKDPNGCVHSSIAASR